jgi:hypothetical protein
LVIGVSIIVKRKIKVEKGKEDMKGDIIDIGVGVVAVDVEVEVKVGVKEEVIGKTLVIKEEGILEDHLVYSKKEIGNVIVVKILILDGEMNAINVIFLRKI